MILIYYTHTMLRNYLGELLCGGAVSRYKRPLMNPRAYTALLAPLIAHAALIRFIIIINIFTTTYKTNDKYICMYIENKHIIMCIEKKVELPVLPQTMWAYSPFCLSHVCNVRFRLIYANEAIVRARSLKLQHLHDLYWNSVELKFAVINRTRHRVSRNIMLLYEFCIIKINKIVSPNVCFCIKTSFVDRASLKVSNQSINTYQRNRVNFAQVVRN